jgi:GT2 family glycosyltransferase
VDNASSDGTAAFVVERWPSVRVIHAGRNRGFAGGTNLGIRGTASELVLLLNPDTIVPPGALDRLADVLRRHPEAAVVGPRLVDAGGRAELSFGRMVSATGELRQKLLVRGHAARLPIIARYVEQMTRGSRRVDWVSGACLLARRADLETVGLLDERFFLYLEDVDLCASIRARGRAVLFESRVEVTHLRGRSGAANPGRTSAAYRRSQLAFYEKHHPRWAPVLRLYLKSRGALPDTPISP